MLTEAYEMGRNDAFDGKAYKPPTWRLKTHDEVEDYADGYNDAKIEMNAPADRRFLLIRGNGLHVRVSVPGD
mgnify:CR=1 FL=1